ncbi:MAG: GNAT family N-acetyltransferase [Armatimonadetes bacterium]|nr:GNAT family N-acetyltransferase [Armatimonadota bacterium]
MIPNQWCEPVELTGQWVRLVPLELSHADGLFEVCPEDTFDHFLRIRPVTHTVEAFRDYVSSRLAAPAVTSFTVLDAKTGGYIGETAYLDIRHDARHVEIGMTWYSADCRGTNVNPECKLLLLQHAFEVLGAIRVTLKTAKTNLHSQAAIRKLGGVYEGTLRKHGIKIDGQTRDTVYFSILDEEWPQVKRNLFERLGIGPKPA